MSAHLWKVEFERTQTAVVYVLADSADAALVDAEILVCDSDYRDELDPESYVTRKRVPPTVMAWSGGPDGDWLTPREVAARIGGEA